MRVSTINWNTNFHEKVPGVVFFMFGTEFNVKNIKSVPNMITKQRLILELILWLS